MWYKPYGKTGKNISAISFGGMRFDKPEDIDANAQVVLHAYKQGINYFDTAPYYCNDKSEEIVGAAVKQMKPGTFYVSTKSNVDGAADLRSSLDRSLKRLNVPRINFFHIWCVYSLEHWKRRVAGGAVAEAIKAKKDGLIEHIVVSSHMESEDLTKVLEDGPFEGVTLGYSAINFPYRQEAIDAAGKRGLGVVTMNPLAGGLIPKHADRFAFLKDESDPSVTAAALRFIVSQPAITSALVGFTTTQQIDEAVAAVADFKPWSAERVDGIRKRVMAAFNGLCTGCGYCLPCPQAIAIPQMMDSYNMKLLSGTDADITGRLKWHWANTVESAAGCSMCGACETRCTQKLPIRERMKYIGGLVEKK